MTRQRFGLRLGMLVLASATLLASAETPKQPNHNGNWWRSQSSTYHNAFLSGYKAGAHHATGKPTDLYNFTADELVIGLDKFYDDFRNRNIQIDDAIPVVADQLRGVADNIVDARVLKLRAAAAQTNANRASE